MRDTNNALIAHCGGPGVISETRRMAARRVSVLETELIFLEDKFAQARAAGDEPHPRQLDRYGRLADRQRRLAEALGWERTSRDVTPTLDEYLRHRRHDTIDATAEPIE